MLLPDSRIQLKWLSHALDERTPAYGGGAGFSVNAGKSLARGDSCSVMRMTLSNHLGSHVDAPSHFLHDSSTLDAYGPSDWVFSAPRLVDLSPVEPGSIIGPSEVERAVDACNAYVDLLLIRTGFEKWRGQDVYWRENPGFSPDLAEYLISTFPGIKAIGFDSISLSSHRHREIGREAHRRFLGANVRIFEDLALSQVNGCDSLLSVVALPLRIAGADGAPCTILAWDRTA